jgi:hypothetical protein
VASDDAEDDRLSFDFDSNTSSRKTPEDGADTLATQPDRQIDPGYATQQQQHATTKSAQTLAMLHTSIAYVKQVTQILSTVQDDATARAAIVQIDALADERTAFNELGMQITAYGVTAQDKAQYDRLKSEYDALLPAL